MGLRFRQSFKLFPGVRLNISKSGISASFGVPGATLNIGPQGLRSTVGMPGTGVSYRTQHGFSTEGDEPQQSNPQSGGVPVFHPPAPNGSPQPPPPPPIYWQATNMREIGSASVEQLTSESLRELRDTIAEARSQRNDIQEDLRQARDLLQSQTSESERRQRSLFRYFYKRRITELEAAIPETNAEVERLESWLEATHVAMRFETGDAAQKAYASLVRAFEALRSSARIWDITSDRNTHRVLERTAASRILIRDPAVVEFSTSDLVRFEGRPMRFQNVNGEDILIYPGIAVMPRADGAFALIDLREMRLESNVVQFIEEEAIPPDAQVVGQAWAKANKDGSPDLRFKDNYAIPVCVYGRLLFTSPAGIEEEYQFSNAEAAANFARAFFAYQIAISAE
jgi:hypothetical protein